MTVFFSSVFFFQFTIFFPDNKLVDDVWCGGGDGDDGHLLNVKLIDSHLYLFFFIFYGKKNLFAKRKKIFIFIRLEIWPESKDKFKKKQQPMKLKLKLKSKKTMNEWMNE